jgi:hypothetical protein
MDAEMLEPEVLAYRKGQRLVICAPFADRKFYDRSWPFDMRGFPVAVYKSYWHPTRTIPESETSYNWTLALMLDASLRNGHEQMLRSHGIILAPEDGLNDAYGEPYAFSDYRDVAFYNEDVINPGAIQFFQPAGINQALPAWRQMIENVFFRNKSNFDLGLTPESSKDIAGVALKQMIETGNIPLDHKIRRFQRFKTIILNRIYEMIRATWTPAKAQRLLGDMEGAALYKNLMTGLPNVDIRVSADPRGSFARDQDFQKLVSIIQEPSKARRRLLARGINLAPSWLDELDRGELKEAADAKAVAEESETTPQGGDSNGVAALMARAGVTGNGGVQ